jgi:hypothetical protein
MEPANDLIAELRSATDRYNQLLARYNEFIAQITALLKADDRFIDVQITRNPNDSITITFLDRKLLVTFKFSTIEGSRVGYINCYLKPSEPETEMKNIHSFSFNAQGVTNIEVQNDNDPYEIHNHKDAVNILAYWLKQSLNESL